MSMKEDLADFESRHPGVTQRIWQANGSGYTAEHDAKCAKALIDFARLCGESLDITTGGWEDHRLTMNIRAMSRKPKHAEDSPIPDSITSIHAESLINEVSEISTAIYRQTLVLERLVSVLEQRHEDRLTEVPSPDDNGSIFKHLT